jgi:RNAse (barnase) inhibitor barstar
MDTQHQQFHQQMTKAVKLSENNSKAIDALLNGLSDTIFTKATHCKSTKEIYKLRKFMKEIQTKKQSLNLQRSFQTTKNEGR